MKRKIAFFTASALLISAAGAMAGCGSGDPYKDFNDLARLYAERSVLLNESVREKYWWGDETMLMFHAYPNETEDATGTMSSAFAWPYTETVAANWRVATLSDGAKKKIKSYYKRTLDGFEYYRAFRNDHHAYCASRAGNIGYASGDTYYDDNVWISREFLNAYEILGGEDYLQTSINVAKYVWSGWANDDLGGIYWCEQKKNSRNTCSNAPASLLFARLYETTQDGEWLERAKRVYDWTHEKLMDPSDNVYWDNISNEGNITNWKFTYNTGSMISAGVKLYEITKEERYLNEAKASAKGAFNYWFKDRAGRDYKVIDSTNPWFNVLLLAAWTELYPHDKAATLPYIEAYEANLNYAYADLSDENLMAPDWANGWKRNEDGSVNYGAYGGDYGKGVNVLDMAANAENFGTLAYFYQYIKE